MNTYCPKIIAYMYDFAKKQGGWLDTISALSFLAKTWWEYSTRAKVKLLGLFFVRPVCNKNSGKARNFPPMSNFCDYDPSQLTDSIIGYIIIIAACTSLL